MPPALRPFCLTTQFEPPTHPGGLRRLGKGLSPKSVPTFLAGWARLVSPRQRPVVASRFAGIGMGVWLVSHFTIFAAQAQNWMPLALALIAGAIIFAWVSNSDRASPRFVPSGPGRERIR
jgi:hypothetical protein